MEDILGECLLQWLISGALSLNPCFNGRYSRRYKTRLLPKPPLSLNSYSKGTLSDLFRSGHGRERICLNPYSNGILSDL